MWVKRVAIVGCGGAGKSVLARELGRRTGIPVVHLDELYWGPEWEPCPAEEWQALHRRLVERETWILDGNYGATMESRLAAADTVIFLDVPTWVCLRRVLMRRVKGFLPRPRADIPGRERLTLSFLRWIVGYPRERRPRVLRRLADLDSGTRVVILGGNAELREFLDALTEPFRC